MNLQGIRYRFSIFLKQFRIDDLKLLMKFLNEIVNEYKNSKAARLFDLLSFQESDNSKAFNLLYGDQFEIDLKPVNKLQIKKELKQKRNSDKLRRLKLLRARKTLLKSTNSTFVHEKELVIKSEQDESLNSNLNESIATTVSSIKETDDLIDRQRLLVRDNLRKNLVKSLDNSSVSENIDETVEHGVTNEPKRIRVDLTQSNLIPNRIHLDDSDDLRNVIKCAVCSDLASGTRYGVCVCEGCKEFFRRQRENPLNNKVLKCVQGTNNCDINVANRTHCRKCRLDKCVKLGMKLSAKFHNLYFENKKDTTI